MDVTKTKTLEWVANAILVVGTIINSLGYYPIGAIILGLGGAVWLVIAIRWQSKSLIAINSFMILATILSVIYVIFFKVI